MKEFIRPLDKTINGRIKKANLSDAENEVRRLILKNYILKGKSPVIQDLSAQLKISDSEISLILESLKKADIINLKNNEVISAYPFSDKETDFIVKIAGNTNVFALCATDAVGIHFLTKQDCLIKTSCPFCKNEISIEMANGKIIKYQPDSVIEFVSLPENCGCTSSTFCPTIKFFCNKDHIGMMKYDFSGEIYNLEEVAYHSKKIFSNLLEL